MPSIKRLLKFAQHNPKPTQSALRGSAAPSSSGFTFVDNSQGASAAVAELSGALGAVLENINLDGDVGSQVKVLTERLDDEASRYSNSQLKDEQCQSWSCTQEQGRLISIAWKCASDSYDASLNHRDSVTQTVEKCKLMEDHVVAPSADGTVKAVVFTTVAPINTPSNDLLPVLVVAIRGSASTVDHMVNANGDPRDATHFINIPGLQAHRGFLAGASALDSIVSDRIEQYIRTGGNRVLFTGHSAGGAVASLLYLRYLSQQNDGTRFSCVTFGAPPVVSLPVELDRTKSGLCLNIINEFDLVSRSDKPYILSLVNLVRNMYDQPPLHEDSDSVQSLDGKEWPILQPAYCHIGPRVVLQMRLGEEDSLQLRAVEVSQSEFEKLLFCRVTVHKRDVYEQRVKLLANGMFNGAQGWDTQS